MIRSHAFPWREEEVHVGRRHAQRVLLPTVDIELRLSDLSIRARALIDTGSPRSVFPRGVGDLLAVHFPEIGGDKTIRLMGHTWPAISATVTLELAPLEESWEAKVDFVVEEGLPFALLGYEGFFNRRSVSTRRRDIYWSNTLTTFMPANVRSRSKGWLAAADGIMARSSSVTQRSPATSPPLCYEIDTTLFVDTRGLVAHDSGRGRSVDICSGGRSVLLRRVASTRPTFCQGASRKVSA